MADHPLPEPDVAREWLKTMMLIRRFEERAGEMYAKAKVGGFLHLAIGEEATIVGSERAMRADDFLISTYRSHGHALVRGTDPNGVMAELFGRTDGVSKGRGGSMHMFDLERRMMGGYGIVGGQIPPATGAAFAIDYRSKAGKKAEAVMCLLGDATTNIGAFHESLNLAGLWKLPIVYVIVNNRLGMGTPVEKASAEPDLYKRGSAYRIPGARVDGDDPIAVRDAALAALEKARADRQPSILETMSFRLKGHSVVDPARYRSKEDNEEAQANDPVPAFRNRLLKAGALDEKAADDIHDAIEKRVTDAVEFADASPDPSPDELFDAVYATPVANESRAYPGDSITTVRTAAS